MITSGQGTAGATAVRLFPVPAGPCTVLLANTGTASPVYVGMGTALTTSNGFPVPSGAVSPVVIPVYPGSAGGTLYAVTASGAANVGWIITSPTGQTGF